jgi:hypothetical protein
MDSGSYLAADKKVIAAALSLVETRELSSNDITLCPSVSYGLLCVIGVGLYRPLSQNCPLTSHQWNKLSLWASVPS